MYQVGHCLLQACICIDGPKPFDVNDVYMRFNPNATIYHYSGKYGAYWSQMIRVAEYVKINDLIQELVVCNNVLNNLILVDTLTHALVFDFMAFVGQSVGYYRSRDELAMDMIRRGIKQDVHAESNLLFEDSGLRRVFLAVVK